MPFVSHPKLPFPLLKNLSALILLGTALGCSRSLYRKRADREAYGAIREKSQTLAESLDLSDTLLSPSIEPASESRLFDAANPDAPTMPPDDPLSHTLMREVDGKKGSSLWHPLTATERTPDSEWRKLLASDSATGEVVLDLKGAMRLARLHSRDFQREKEDLYLSALDVTFERFQFSPMMALGSKGTVDANGSKSGASSSGPSRGAALTDGSVRWLSATGGELLANFANSFVWSFGGNQAHDSAASAVNMSLVQPLLRLGGRAVTLERLTQSERTLLSNVRQMEQFQGGFYVRTIAGRNSGEGPSRQHTVGASGLGLLAGTPSGRAGTPVSGGYLSLLEIQQRISNQESNVARLRESLDQLTAAFNAGRISNRLQVDQARQALYSAQSTLLSAKAAYQTQLDTYKIELGLPPELPLTARDPMLERYKALDPSSAALDRKLAVILGKIRSRDSDPTHVGLHAQISELLLVENDLSNLIRAADQNLRAFRAALPVRKKQLESLSQLPEIHDLSIESEYISPSHLDPILTRFSERIESQSGEVRDVFNRLREFDSELNAQEPAAARSKLSDLASQVSGLLLSISLNQTAIRLESAVLPEMSLSESKALETAKEHRLDWMNARARLVDHWRQINLTANALQSGLSLTLKGSVSSLKNEQPLSFDARTRLLQAGLRFDTPLNRLAERNDYRESQIEYQRARRDYMLFEDRISQSLRNTLRIIRMAQLNFEIRRAAVQAAIAQVDLARLRLDEPPKPGASPQFGATTARDLVSALSDLLDAQNDFLSLRVGFDILRLVLDFEMGTMRTDADGLWVDPGSITESSLAHRSDRWREEPVAAAGPNPPAQSTSDLSAPHPSAMQARFRPASLRVR
jgi:outer membrane protein TolC